jgi:hypothetical protein
LYTYLTTKKAKNTEINTIKNILHNTNLVSKSPPPQKENAHNNPKHQTTSHTAVKK